MQPTIPFSYPRINEDISRLKSLLQTGLKVADWRPPESVAVLNLACGRADETGVLVEVLGGAQALGGYLGIDLRGVEIAEARRRWRADPAQAGRVDFRVGDASNLDMVESDRLFDFVFIRHQNFWHSPKEWAQIYELSLRWLKPDGRLAITSYFDREHALARACLAQHRAVSVAEIPHPASRPLPDAPGKSVDRRLAIFRLP